MNLDAFIGGNRFIVGPSRLDSPLALQPLTFGNVLPIKLRAWEETAAGDVVAVDLSSYQITLLVGKSNQRATLGFWQLTTTEGTSRAIVTRASKEAVALALSDSFGPVTVEGGSGSYVVTVVAAGEWELPTATFQGNTLSNVLVFEITPGTDSTPAQYRIEILEVAPARIVPAHWSAGSTTVTNTFTQTSGRLWSLVLSALVDNGFYTLTIDGVVTDFVNFDGGAFAIARALAVAGKPATVIPDNKGGYWVKFAQNVTVATVQSNLVILPWSSGNLDLSSSGVRELLDGLQYTDVKLALILVKDGQTVTVASADISLVMPVNQPATITIDAPLMAGLTFAISDDETHLLVYQNGVLIGSVALEAA